MDWKPERAVQAKIRDKKKIKYNYPDRLKPERAIYAKVKDHDKVTASVRHDPLGASRYQKTSGSKHLQIKDSEQGRFKVVRENSGYCVQCTFPIYLPFSKNFKDPWSRAIGRLLPNSSNLSLCPFIWNSHLFYLHDFFYFWWQYLKQNFQNTKTFYVSLKSVNNKHTFFELMSIWSVSIRERLHSRRETWLSTMERTSALCKMQS